MAEVTANQEMSREEVATYLREFANELDARDTGHPGDERGGRETGEDAGSAAGERHEDDRRGNSGEDSAERVRKERTDAAEQVSDDEHDESSHDESSHDATTENTGHDETTREGDASEGDESERGEREQAAREESGHSTGGKVTFMVGNESATINPPGTVDFEMAVDSDSSLMASGTRETVAFELHWNSEEVSGDDDLGVH